MVQLLRSRVPAKRTESGPAPTLKADDEDTASRDAEQNVTRIQFMSLPTEIHLAISKHLIYPDALSLKHTNAYFYSLVHTGVGLKVEWLVERRSLHLECPDRRCDLGSDLRFCRGSVP